MFKYLDRYAYFIPLGFGAISFYLIIGLTIFNPLQDGWLLNGGDLTQQYFGWAFFRNSPWTMPLGLNPMYGMDISSSIVYSDGNPLLSLLFKPFNELLPTIFQFQGLWLLICFLMQGYFAWKILGLYTQNHLAQALGATLFIFSVPMLFRMGVHTNLAAHFLLLGALYLNLRPYKEKQNYLWISLLFISLGVHFYLFAMIFALWLADLGDRKYSQKISKINSGLKSFLVIILLILISAWQFGYFAVKAPSLFGYGFFKANLLSIFNPNEWSYFIKDIAIKSSWGEGNLYLGLGVFILLILGLLKTRSWPGIIKYLLRNYKFLLFALFLLSLFSITNQIGIGSLEFRIPIAGWILEPFGILRHSARMFWPVYYSILIAGCLLVLHSYKKPYSCLIFSLCLCIQIIDLSPGIIKLHRELNKPVKNDITSLPLHQPFWNLAGQRYKNIYLLPSRSEPNPDFMSRFMASDWKIFGRYALLNRLNTNAVYMSRYDPQKQSQAFNNSLQLTNNGLYDKNTIYIIKDEDLIPVVIGLKDLNTLLAKIDGFNVLAPDFLEAVDINLIGKYLKIDLDSIRPSLHQEISFKLSAAPLSSYALTKDWNNREDWGTWSKSKDVVLTFALPAIPAKSLTLTLRALVNGVIPQQTIRVSADGEMLGNFSLSKFEGNVIKLKIPHSALKMGYISLKIEVPNAASPSSIGMADDTRVLGIGIVAAKFD